MNTNKDKVMAIFRGSDHHIGPELDAFLTKEVSHLSSDDLGYEDEGFARIYEVTDDLFITRVTNKDGFSIDYHADNIDQAKQIAIDVLSTIIDDEEVDAAAYKTYEVKVHHNKSASNVHDLVMHFSDYDDAFDYFEELCDEYELQYKTGMKDALVAGSDDTEYTITLDIVDVD
ncbi:MAG: hypothetical protein ACRDCN_09050 [Tannerellaceae bacterium]